jgi:hypothetical protein
LFKILKWIEKRREKLYILRIKQRYLNLEDCLEDVVGHVENGNLL